MTPAHAVKRESKFLSAQATPVVFVVDDDVSVRESLESMIDFAGLRAETYACAQDFLKRPRDRVPSCLVMDVMLPDLSGLDLQNLTALLHSYYQGIIYGTREASQNGTS